MPGKTAALIALAALVGLAVYANYGGMGADTQISVLDAKTTMHTANSRDNLETATFAAGCFWGVEQAFRRVKGVMSTSVGYTGGDVEKPTYERVCSGTTGHSEAVHVTFDPEQVTYDELLDVFWGLHDPSRKAGRQYRSAIFFHSPEQEAAATASKAKLEESGKYKGQIATEILPAERFWRAEEYHQQYLEKRKL